ncbi:hypothetical protein AVEN_128689-1 [Araneus ventricosus]|uniref:Uncharacterized protein n=1 Tax=Araneus ventricosus TaxID=182803 RepID=A0A4Y2SN68_ARAVE|nr:hypothetical protein AVEN_128689-1 [Araneus ventricosus]
MPAQVSSSSSDPGSKGLGPSQSSPQFASKREVNVTKLTCLFSETETRRASAHGTVDFGFAKIGVRLQLDEEMFTSLSKDAGKELFLLTAYHPSAE